MEYTAEDVTRTTGISESGCGHAKQNWNRNGPQSGLGVLKKGQKQSFCEDTNDEHNVHITAIYKERCTQF